MAKELEIVAFARDSGRLVETDDRLVVGNEYLVITKDDRRFAVLTVAAVDRTGGAAQVRFAGDGQVCFNEVWFLTVI